MEATDLRGALLRAALTDAVGKEGAGGPACSANPVLNAAMMLGRRLAGGETDLDAAEAVVRALAADAFAERAERLGRYLGDCDPEANRAACERLLEDLADRAGGFEAYADALSRPRFGLVLTGHPTFALARDLSVALVELATARAEKGDVIDADGRAERRALARSRPQGPPDQLTIDVEHDWSLQALHNAADAVDAAVGAALAVARRRWPEWWTALTPRLLTLATWVGFDQDGRTDVTWQVSVGKRLSLKLEALRRLRAKLAPLADLAGGVCERLDAAAAEVERQSALLARALADPAALPAFARAMVEGREAALTGPEPLVAGLDAALPNARTDAAREILLLARASLATQGLGLAHIHVRLNAAQLHAGVREAVGLETDPSDRANRRTYFHAIEGLIEAATPQAINFGSLLKEPSSARRLMMTVAQMAKFIDDAPVRFLIAESESGFTLLAALYLARLFGIEDQVEISPLFETAGGFEAGEHLIEEALRSPAFRAHLERQGRLAIEFGFSDSGRFIGQMAATFRIERLRLRLADMLVRLGLGHVEVVFFNTHGESIGRGGHPGSLADRFRYAAPPRSRAEFAARGIPLKEEDSFQGGEGFLPLLTRAAALATVRAALESVLIDDPEAEDDPIYAAEDFVSEFFATVQQAFTSLVADPNYPTLLSLYGARLLPKTGSRPVQRQAGDAGGPREIGSVHELRAIPNNGVLQQLGWLANTLYGVGRASAKDPVTFRDMLERSPRFRRALEMVAAAEQGSSMQALRGYADLVDPDVWMAEAASAEAAERPRDERLSRRAECAKLEGALGEVIRRLETDALALRDLMPVRETTRRERLRLAHTLRIALMAFIDRLGAAMQPPPGAGGFDPDRVLSSLMRLDVGPALTALREAFPLHEAAPLEGADFGEPASYIPETSHDHAREEAELIAPIARAYALCLQLTTAINHDLGAIG